MPNIAQDVDGAAATSAEKSNFPPPCPLCGSRETKFLCAVDAYRIWRCPTSALDFVHPVPSPAALKLFYDRSEWFEAAEPGGYASYDAQTDPSPAWLTAMLDRLVAERPNPSILDVGCAYGSHLALGWNRGWQAFGVEPSRHARDEARKRHPGLYIAETVEEIPAHRFDLILILDVIEHLSDPYPLFWELASKGAIGPETIVVLTTPNARSNDALIDAARWVFRHPPSHLTYYSASALEELLRRLRFARVEVRGQHPIAAPNATPHADEKSFLNYSLMSFAGLLCEATGSDFAAFMHERYVPGTWSVIAAYEHIPRYALARGMACGKHVLDFGCGTGYGTAMLAEAASSVIGVDISEDALSYVREHHERDNLSFVQDPNLGASLASGSFDLITCFEVIEHVDAETQHRMIAAFHRLLALGGRLLISTPNPEVTALYGENPYHLCELTRPQFEALLNDRFSHVKLIDQSMHACVFMGPVEAEGPVEVRRGVPSFDGESRPAGYLAVCSRSPIEPLTGVVYPDLRLDYIQQKIQALERRNHQLIDRIRLVGLQADLGKTQAELATIEAQLREKDRVIAEHQTRIAELNQVRDSNRAELAQANDLRTELAAARSRPGKVLRHLLAYRVLSYLSTKSQPLSAKRTARFARSAQKRDPKRSLGTSVVSTAPQRTLPAKPGPDAILDAQKKTILVVSHEASRTGAPILTLNIVQQLSTRYNVISLSLGGGELMDDFRRASALLHEADRMRMTDRELDSVIKDIVERHPLTFAIVNSVESRMALRALKAAGVPTVSLIHEFSAYSRPRSAFPDVLTLSTETVFSTRMTLANAVADFCLYPGASIHVVPQGKCVVPATPGVASEAPVEKVWLTRNLRPEGGSRKFLVIGVGSIELRKGVDLFIECATIIKNQPEGERFQFVWIGNGYDPEREVAYSVYLADQMKRAGLGPQMKILRSTSQIELAYQTADLLLLSSRLDPLPNVAIDALISGLPVVCFEKTTGIADFLLESGLGEQCVAQYLDTHDLARKVTILADSEDLRASVSGRSQVAAKSAFDMNAYVSKIEAIAMQAVSAEALVKQDVKTILASGKFRADFFRPPETESPSEEKLVEDYVRRMASGLDIRKPMPGFQPTVYAWLQGRGGQVNGDPFADYLRQGRPDGPWLQRVIQNADAPKNARGAGLRIALHLHVFYQEQLAGIVERLKLNASTPDLFISVTSEDSAARVREALSTYRGRIVDVQVTPNIGPDIGPLPTQFGRVLCASYEIIGHLHTWNSVLLGNPSFAEAWNTFLLENLVGGKRGGAMLDLIFSSMASDPTIGIVFPDDPHVLSWTSNRKYADELAARMKCGGLPEQFNFPVGAMFWMRSAVLKRFVDLDLAWGDYEPEPPPIDGTTIHAIEQLFGIVPAAMGMTCAVTNVRGVTR